MTRNDMQVSRVTRSKQQAKSTYDRISRWYDLLAGPFERKYRDAGIHRLNPRPGQIILEVGFGTGHSIVALAQSVGPLGKVYGIDISEGMLNIAQTRVEEAGVGDRVVLSCGDASQLPYKTSFFDGVFISFTLELFDTPEIPVVLSECRRVLRSGGRICVVAMAKTTKPNATMRLYEWFHEKFPQYIDCRPILVHESLQNAGFRIINVTPFSLLGLRGEIVLADNPAPA